MISAFGVDHGGPVSKARSEREKHYGRMANTMGALGGTAGALGAGSGVVAALEHRGHDPMGFTAPREAREKIKPAVKARILRGNVRGHTRQALAAGAVSAATLGIAGAYKHKQKKELAKRSSASDKALDAGAVGVAGAGGYAAFAHGAENLGEPAVQHARVHHHASRYMKAVKAGAAKPGPETLKFVQGQRVKAARVVGVKGTGAAAAMGAAGLGAAGLYEVGRHNLKNRKKS